LLSPGEREALLLEIRKTLDDSQTLGSARTVS
jgi:hypothetical protein